MSKKWQGIITPIGTVIFLVLLGVAVAFMTQSVQSDGWAMLGLFIMFLFITALVMIVLLIVGIVLYYKKQSEYGLGMMIGVGVLLGATGLWILIVQGIDMLGY